MIDIERLQEEIVERLKPLEPENIILFGSYAYGEPDEESDIDLFLVKDGVSHEVLRKYRLSLQKALFGLQKKYLIGVDLFVDSSHHIKYRVDQIKDQFYEEILKMEKSYMSNNSTLNIK